MELYIVSPLIYYLPYFILVILTCLFINHFKLNLHCSMCKISVMVNYIIYSYHNCSCHKIVN